MDKQAVAVATTKPNHIESLQRRIEIPYKQNLVNLKGKMVKLKTLTQVILLILQNYTKLTMVK